MQGKLKWGLAVGMGVAALAGGAAIAGASGDDDGPGERDSASEQVTDRSVIERASAAALKETGGGTVSEVEAADDGQTGYEVEVDRPGGGSSEVNVDRSFKVVSVERDAD
jgi:uncharacterized membrane protein YkoI